MKHSLYRTYVFDSSKGPVKWATAPHAVYKAVMRYGFSAIGAFIPFGVALIHSGVLRQKRIDENLAAAPIEFVVITLVLICAFLASVIFVGSSEEKWAPKYIFLASAVPANLVLVMRLLSSIGTNA